MKALNKINYFMVGFPLAMALGGLLFEEYLWMYGLLFTAVTGVFQVTVGICMFIRSGCRNTYLASYLAAVAAFFLLWEVTDWEWMMVLPPVLAMYMSALLYLEAEK